MTAALQHTEDNMDYIYKKIKFHSVLYALGIKGWKIKTAPETEEYFLANFQRRTGTTPNAKGESVAVYSSNPSDFGFTWSEFTSKHTEMIEIYDAQDYARKRKGAYPDIYDYMDGIVKNDQTQINKYIADSQAVKVRYPKGA